MNFRQICSFNLYFYILYIQLSSEYYSLYIGQNGKGNKFYGLIFSWDTLDHGPRVIYWRSFYSS